MSGTGETSIRSYTFFADTVLAGGGNYAENQFDFIDMDGAGPFISHSILIANDGGSNLSFRFSADPGSGPAHGRVEAGETLQMDFKRARRIFLSGTAGLTFRLWAW